MKIRCTHCGHVWDTRSMAKYVTCPSCLSKVKVGGTTSSANMRETGGSKES